MQRLEAGQLMTQRAELARSDWDGGKARANAARSQLDLSLISISQERRHFHGGLGWGGVSIESDFTVATVTGWRGLGHPVNMCGIIPRLLWESRNLGIWTSLRLLRCGLQPGRAQ